MALPGVYSAGHREGEGLIQNVLMCFYATGGTMDTCFMLVDKEYNESKCKMHIFIRIERKDKNMNKRFWTVKVQDGCKKRQEQ